jgi:hypothetical protein
MVKMVQQYCFPFHGYRLSTLKRYKEIEKHLYRQGVYAAGQTGRGLFRRLRAFFMAGRQKVTIMFVPHSERKAVNFQVSRFTLPPSPSPSSPSWAPPSSSSSAPERPTSRLSGQIQENGATQSSLDAMRDETARLLKAAQRFKVVLDGTLGSVAVDKGSGGDAMARVGDCSRFFDLEESGRGSVPEVSELGEITDFLERNADKIKQLGELYGSSDVMSAIPTLWPIKSGRGQLSMYFGQNRNPFTRQWYLHKGIDIITFGSGDPVSATADARGRPGRLLPGLRQLHHHPAPVRLLHPLRPPPGLPRPEGAEGPAGPGHRLPGELGPHHRSPPPLRDPPGNQRGRPAQVPEPAQAQGHRAGGKFLARPWPPPRTPS